MKHLERNERIVSWLQPRGGGVQDQVPAVRVKGVYYTLSLRMMKCIWRHVSLLGCSVNPGRSGDPGGGWQVRLRKGFVNTESAAYGGRKLRIPSLLFTEKMRTQNRFNVSVRANACGVCYRFNVRVLAGARLWCVLQVSSELSY